MGEHEYSLLLESRITRSVISTISDAALAFDPYKDVPDMVKELKSFGLLGMECVYPYHERTGKVEYYKSLSREFDLIITGSRDFHGSSTYQSEHMLGATKMDTRFLEQFKEVWEG